MAIKALVFDAYGTLYDVHSVYTRTEELCPGKGDLITQIWRLKQLEYTWLQTSLQQYRDFAFVTKASLDFALRATGIEPSDSITQPLFDKYLDLDPYAEAKDALGRLKNIGGRPPANLSKCQTALLAGRGTKSGPGAHLALYTTANGGQKVNPPPPCYVPFVKRRS